jgi:hypothetical protein
MFSCGLKEAQDGEVTFHDIQPEVLLSVINFIYTGKIQVSPKSPKSPNTRYASSSICQQFFIHNMQYIYLTQP